MIRRIIPYLSILIAVTLCLHSVWVDCALAQNNTPPNLEVTINRILWINEWGVTSLNDTVTIVNRGDDKASHITIGVPARLQDQLKYFEAVEPEGRNIRVEELKDANYAWLKYSFPEEVRKGDVYRFTTLTVFSDVVTYIQRGYLVDFTATPILEGNVDLYNLTVTLPADATFTLPENSIFDQIKYAGLPALHKEYRGLEPYTEEPLRFFYTSVSMQLLNFQWAKRVLTIEPDGSLRIADSYKLYNPALLVSSIPMNLPKGAKDIMAYDQGGNIWDEPQTGDLMTVTPRYGRLKSNESFYFTLKYTVPKEEYIKRLEWWGRYELSFTLITPQPWIIDRVEVEVVMPKGAHVEDVNQPPDIPSSSFYNEILFYNLTGVTPYTPLSLEAKIKYPLLWAAFKPLIWIVIAIAVITVFAVARPREKIEGEVVTKPIDALKQFSEIQDEKMAVRLEMENVEEARSRRAISKKEYRRRRGGLESRISRLNRVLKPIKEELKTSHLRYDEFIGRLDRAEAQIEASRASLRNVRAQYRAGRIDKGTFQTMETDLMKRIKKSKEDVDSIVVTLREEAA